MEIDNSQDESEENDADFDSEEGKENARRLESYRRGIIEERWLLTHILTSHLDIESAMNELLRHVLPKPEKLLDKNSQKPTFSQKLTLCEALNVIDEDRAIAVRVLNKLRNESAHTPGYIPTLDELSRFIASMSKMHPLSVAPSPKEKAIELHSVEQIREHFEQTERDEVEHFVFISILLLKANISTLLNQDTKEATA